MDAPKGIRNANRLQLSVVEFNDLAFIDIGVELASLGETEELALELVDIDFDIGGNLGLLVDSFLDDLQGLAGFLEGDDIVDGAEIGRDIDLLAVDGDMAMVDKLTGLPSGRGEAKAVDKVVETGLKDLHEVGSGDLGAVVLGNLE